MQYVAMDNLFPEWRVWERFVTTDFHRAMNLDSLASSHPVEVNVKNPAQITEIFDAISYSKGCCVNRMCEAYVGRENFRKGLHNYLLKHAYANTVSDDLWNALEEVSGLPVTKMMHLWIYQVSLLFLSRHSDVHSDTNCRPVIQPSSCSRYLVSRTMSSCSSFASVAFCRAVSRPMSRPLG